MRLFLFHYLSYSKKNPKQACNRAAISKKYDPIHNFKITSRVPREIPPYSTSLCLSVPVALTLSNASAVLNVSLITTFLSTSACNLAPIFYIVVSQGSNSITVALRCCRYLSTWWIKRVQKKEKSNKIRLLNGCMVISGVCTDIRWRKRRNIACKQGNSIVIWCASNNDT